MTDNRTCDLDGTIIRTDAEPGGIGAEEYFSVTNSLTGETLHICHRCARSTNSAPAWAANTAKLKGARVKPTAGISGYVYTATVAGTTGASQPTWPTTIGATIVDGTLTWITEGAPRSGAVVKTQIPPASAVWHTLYEWFTGAVENPDGTHTD